MSLILGVPPSVVDLVQQGLLERAFHDGLFPALLYRGEAPFEEWPANSGTEVFMSRPGLMAPVTTPLVPGVDPLPQDVPFEQWVARLDRYGSSVDTHIPTSVVANSNLFLRRIKQLGLNAGQSVNRIARNALFKPYLSGNTVSITAAAAVDTSIRVASLNGFADVIITGANVRPVPVSPVSPLAVRIFGVAGTRNVIGVTPDDPADFDGPGTLQLSAPLGAIVPARSPVISSAAPRIVRSGGGDSVDAIGPADTFVLQDAINSVAFLRDANVPPHDDGYYHCHINAQANAQVFSDPAFQRLNTSLPEYAIYRTGFIGSLAGVMFYMNSESPRNNNSGPRVATGANAFYSKDIGAETTNDAGINIGRIIITGKGSIYERGLDESQYVTEAGVTGRTGEFQIVNNGVQVMVERVKLILRAPLNRTQDQVAATWTITTSFPCPSDITAPSGPERFKRAVIIEHALLELLKPV